MRAPARLPEQRPARTGTPAAGASARRAVPAAAQALVLQRLAGNRVTGRVLARWVRHPDEEQKGVMVPDVAAADLLRFNPPQNK